MNFHTIKKATLQFSVSFFFLVDLPNLALFFASNVANSRLGAKKAIIFQYRKKVTITKYLWLIHINYNHLLVFTMCVLWPFFFIRSRSVVLFFFFSHSHSVQSHCECHRPFDVVWSSDDHILAHSDKNVWCDPNNNKSTRKKTVGGKKSISTIYAVMILNALRIQMHGLIRMIRQKETKKNTHTTEPIAIYSVSFLCSFSPSVSLSIYIHY